jgi:(1->4)-alpha-D-glucan 1-alpha-D-glucosylmutase
MELPAFTLVDPDNRRPVDFDAAAARLDEIHAANGSPRALLDDVAGGSKLYVTSKLLHLRRAEPELFARGAYQPLQVEGARKDHVFAFARTLENRSCIVVVPRWSAKLMNAAPQFPLGLDVWGDTRVVLSAVTANGLEDVLGNRHMPAGDALMVGEILAELPVATLTLSLRERAG